MFKPCTVSAHGVIFFFFFPHTWYDKVGSDVKVQGESKHVVDAVDPRHPEQLQHGALPLLLPLINNGAVAAQHHGGPASPVGLGRPRVQLPLARLHV